MPARFSPGLPRRFSASNRRPTRPASQSQWWRARGNCGGRSPRPSSRWDAGWVFRDWLCVMPWFVVFVGRIRIGNPKSIAASRVPRKSAWPNTWTLICSNPPRPVRASGRGRRPTPPVDSSLAALANRLGWHFALESRPGVQACYVRVTRSWEGETVSGATETGRLLQKLAPPSTSRKVLSPTART